MVSDIDPPCEAGQNTMCAPLQRTTKAFASRHTHISWFHIETKSRKSVFCFCGNMNVNSIWQLHLSQIRQSKYPDLESTLLFAFSTQINGIEEKQLIITVAIPQRIRTSIP
jgi:hypothetical protein